MCRPYEKSLLRLTVGAGHWPARHIPERREGQAPPLPSSRKFPSFGLAHLKQFCRPLEPGGPVCRPYKKRPQIHRRGRTLAGPPYPGTAGGASPSPTVLKKLFRDWVGEDLGPPAVDDSGQKVTLIRPLRGHLSLSPLSLRDIIPTPFGLRPFPPDRGNRPLDKGSRPPWRGKAGRAADSRPYGGYRSRSQTGPQLRTSYHLFGQTRRSRGTAPAEIFANSGPSGPE